MEPELKKEWMAALRSGEYEQGKEALRPAVVDEYDDDNEPLSFKPTNTFCCLGVLCDILAKKGRGVWVDDISGDGQLFRYKSSDASPSFHADLDTEATGLLPDAMAADLGISREVANNLARLNDNGEPFQVIADTIEREVL